MYVVGRDGVRPIGDIISDLYRHHAIDTESIVGAALDLLWPMALYLRRKLGEGAIETVRGMGYRLRD